MEHQDWTSVTMKTKKPTLTPATKSSKTQLPQTTTIEKVLIKEPIGKLIAQARLINGKNQKELAAMIGISQQILARWEANKELPTNAQIALLEKTLKVKLPRSKKVYINEN